MTNQTQFVDFISLGLIQQLETLAGENNCVLWIRNQDYQQQLYVSSNYQTLWGRDCYSIYQSPSSWAESLDILDAKAFSDELKKNRLLINPNYTAIYSIILPDHKKEWFQDRSFHLPAGNGKQFMVAGCALHIKNKKVIKTEQAKISDKLDFIITRYHSILSTIFHTTDHDVNTSDIKLLENLSITELKIYKLILEGMSYSQIADTKKISLEKINDIVDNLKSKLFCDSKSELIIKALQNISLFNLYILNNPHQSRAVSAEVPKLSKKESEIIFLLLDGKSAKDSARELNISSRTVEKHLEVIKRKFHCKTKIDLIAYILRHFRP